MGPKKKKNKTKGKKSNKIKSKREHYVVDQQASSKLKGDEEEEENKTEVPHEILIGIEKDENMNVVSELDQEPIGMAKGVEEDSHESEDDGGGGVGVVSFPKSLLSADAEPFMFCPFKVKDVSVTPADVTDKIVVSLGQEVSQVKEDPPDQEEEPLVKAKLEIPEERSLVEKKVMANETKVVVAPLPSRLLVKPPRPIASMKHPLRYRWSLWHFFNHQGYDWSENQRLVLTVDTVEDFFCLYNWVQKCSELTHGHDYSFFKEGIKP